MTESKPGRMSVSLQRETAEAICGGLWRTNLFAYIGDSADGASTYFLWGEAKPKLVHVEVLRSALANVVMVNVKFPRFKPTFGIGRITFTVDTNNRQTAIVTSGEVVERILEICRDVLTESGVTSQVTESSASEGTTDE